MLGFFLKLIFLITKFGVKSCLVKIVRSEGHFTETSGFPPKKIWKIEYYDVAERKK